VKIPPSRRGNVLRRELQELNQKRKRSTKRKSSRFESLAARYYHVVYSFGLD
jgi:hypothetical protein